MGLGGPGKLEEQRRKVGDLTLPGLQGQARLWGNTSPYALRGRLSLSLCRLDSLHSKVPAPFSRIFGFLATAAAQGLLSPHAAPRLPSRVGTGWGLTHKSLV